MLPKSMRTQNFSTASWLKMKGLKFIKEGADRDYGTIFTVGCGDTSQDITNMGFLP
jgi:hypothetical protein